MQVCLTVLLIRCTETSDRSTAGRQNRRETELARERLFLVYLRKAKRQGKTDALSHVVCPAGNERYLLQLVK